MKRVSEIPLAVMRASVVLRNALVAPMPGEDVPIRSPTCTVVSSVVVSVRLVFTHPDGDADGHDQEARDA